MKKAIREPYMGLVFISFVIATIIFIVVFLFAYSVSYYKYQSIFKSQEKIKLALDYMEVQKEFVLSKCDFSSLYLVGKDLDEMGSIIGILEDRFGKTDPKVVQTKEGYSLLELKHFEFITEFSKKCSNPIDTVLFFYSNDKNMADDSDKIGYILTRIKEDRKDKIMIYSFDYNIHTPEIEEVKKKYNVTMAKTIIINEKIKLESVGNINEIMKYIGKGREIILIN